MTGNPEITKQDYTGTEGNFRVADDSHGIRVVLSYQMIDPLAGRARGRTSSEVTL